MCCTEALTRILVFVANFAFLLVGVALLSIGILYTLNYTDFLDAIPADYQNIQHIPIITIVVGGIIFFIAFLGCCGTLKSSVCMLSSYAGILLFIFFAQIALGAYGLWTIKDNHDLQTKIDNHLEKLFLKYNSTKDITGSIDLIQEKFQCCGINSSSWWTHNATFAGIPKSCYSDNDPDNNNQKPFQQGCASAVFNYVNSSMRIIGIVVLTISTVELIAAILALGLANCIRGNLRRQAYY